MTTSRWRLLLAVFEEGETNITKLSKRCSMRYDVLKREIDYLESRGVIEVISGGNRAKLIRLNYSNPKVLILKDLVEEVKEIFE